MSGQGAAISRTDLARHTRRVLERARRSGPVIVTGHGDEQAVVLDITDYRLLRAAAAYRLQQEGAQPRAKAEMPRGLSEEEVQAAIEAAGGNVQAGWNRVMAAYWDGDISLGRAAELLSLSRFELMERLHRLGLPMYMGPQTVEDLEAELAALEG